METLVDGGRLQTVDRCGVNWTSLRRRQPLPLPVIRGRAREGESLTTDLRNGSDQSDLKSAGASIAAFPLRPSATSPVRASEGAETGEERIPLDLLLPVLRVS